MYLHRSFRPIFYCYDTHEFAGGSTGLVQQSNGGGEGESNKKEGSGEKKIGTNVCNGWAKVEKEKKKKEVGGNKTKIELE